MLNLNVRVAVFTNSKIIFIGFYYKAGNMLTSLVKKAKTDNKKTSGKKICMICKF